jgi:hypothetical protein
MGPLLLLGNTLQGDSTNTIPRKIDDMERRRISGTGIRSSSPGTNRA